jgi:CRISPR system Cascade subunit CasA
MSKDQQDIFNLVQSFWLPVRRRTGAVEWVRPADIVSQLENNPFVGFAWGRPDFDTAAHEFMIGLLATAMAPEDEDEWEDIWDNPPSVEKLSEKFAFFSPYFNLDGPGPRFMQDFDNLADAEEREVGSLLIDAPGDNAIIKNTDHFVKRARTPILGRAAAAMALFTLQTYAPSGGAGHRTSLRGGGPLTTLVEDMEQPTLWHRLWLAVETLEALKFRNAASGKLPEPSNIFPWMASTRTSDPKAAGVATSAADVHALQVYWGTPRRIRFIFEAAVVNDVCSLTGVADSVVVKAYRTKNYGVDYTDGFRHPLTPYYRTKPGEAMLPIHGQPGGVGYRHWLGFLLRTDDNLRDPARVVVTAIERLGRKRDQLRLLASGYDMDNMKPRGFIVSSMPIIAIADPDMHDHAKAFTHALITSAGEAKGLMMGAVRSALFDNPSDARGDLSFIGERLWRETEADFYDKLRDLTTLDLDKPNADSELREAWLKILQKTAIRLFDEVVAIDTLEQRDMARIAGACRNLLSGLRGYSKGGKSLFKALGVPLPVTKAKREIPAAVEEITS